MKREQLTADTRTILGKKVKKLRRDGLLPANVYGQNHKSVAIQISFKDFNTIFKKVGETGLVDLHLGKEVLPVLIHDTQINPKTHDVIHADLLVVNLKEKITAKVPVEAVGEAPAVQEKKGLLLQLSSDIEVEALPADLPEKVEVPIENLNEVNDIITVADIKTPSSFSITADPTTPLFKIGELVVEEVVEEVAPEEGAEEAPTEEGAEEATPEDGAPQEESQE